MDEPPVLLYDNGCGVCHWAVRFVLRNDSRGRFRFAPLDSAAGRRLLGQYAVNQTTDSVVLIVDARAFIRSDTVIRVLRELGWPWRAMGVAAILPKSWRDAVYDGLAARRAAISSRFGLVCTQPTIGERARFLDREDTERDRDVT
jgi:predicted DCC family thiol-disulfide oxidoreductase YuxK